MSPDMVKMAARNTEAARALTADAQLVAPTPAEQVLALVSAATAILERDIGAASAGQVLSALLEPTYADWRAAAAARAN